MRNQGGFLSELLRPVIVFGLVAAICWYGFNHGWLDKLNDYLDDSGSSTSASPQWDSDYGAAGKDKVRPYKGYTEKAVEKLKNNIGSFQDEPGYSRDKFFIYDGNSWNKVSRQESQDAGWKDFDNKNCTTRKAVLIEQGSNVAVKKPCTITSGVFTDAYGDRKSDGKISYKKSSQPKDFDIDHVVALSLAWRSGFYAADDSLRNMVANDRANLVISDPSLNRSKGDQAIDTWFPPKGSVGHCDYVDRYAYMKAKYNMIVTQAEYDSLAHLASTCKQK